MKGYYFLFLFLLVIALSSWGFLAHRSINQLAIYNLPEPLRMFYFAHAKQIVTTSVDPDLRRSTDSTEETKHFIDLDGPLYKGKAVPNSWEKVIKKYGEQKVRKEGSLPWEIQKTYKNLISAFKEKTKLQYYSIHQIWRII